MTGILLVAIGIMNNAIVTSGIGNGFSLMIAQWSQGSIVLAILLIGLFGLFGMYAVNALIQLHAEGPLNVLKGSLLIIGGIGSFWPLNLPLNILGAGLVVLAALLFLADIKLNNLRWHSWWEHLL